MNLEEAQATFKKIADYIKQQWERIHQAIVTVIQRFLIVLTRFVRRCERAGILVRKHHAHRHKSNLRRIQSYRVRYVQ